ncbi:MAG: hypothetical protein KTR35_01550 [Gammaproteobacteria bacterium]|nr:hypothetical protein [Gammaproteobacteria bacterium]
MGMQTFARKFSTGAALDDLDRVENWTRTRYALQEKDIVLVNEQENRTPGFPRLETVVTFWAEQNIRYRFRIFKPVKGVVETDLPVTWLKPSLIDYGDIDCC